MVSGKDANRIISPGGQNHVCVPHSCLTSRPVGSRAQGFAVAFLLFFSRGMQRFHPMPLQKRSQPFDDPDWLFELKYDGFRALAIIEHGHAQLISRNGHTFASFADLAKNIATSIPSTNQTVLEGEIVCVDKKGRPQFKDLLFRRGDPSFFVFDLLADGKDCRTERLIDRKQELRRLLMWLPVDSRMRYVDHIDRHGTALFDRVCELDLEGMVAKQRYHPM
jgi:bifunctional non-homologous end joining protein LigD